MKVSVIVPVHNQEANLERCVSSLLHQTHRDIEIILVENGSTDRSLKMCEDFARKDSRIEVACLEGAGVSIARNTGLSLATGAYVMFCDSDDWVEKNWVSHLHDRLLDGDFEVAVSGFTRIAVRTSPEVAVMRHIPDVNRTSLELRDCYLLERWGLLNSPWNKIYRRDIILRNEIEFDSSISIAEDLLFNLQYLKCATTIALVPESTYNYRIAGAGTLSSTYVDGEWEVAKRVRAEFQALLKGVPEAWETYGSEFWTVYLDILERVVHRRLDARVSGNLKAALQP